MRAVSAELLLACSSAVCFGAAVVTSRFGLRSLDARAGAAISIPAATVLFIAAAPFTIDLSAATLAAAFIFAAVGLLFPALVTLLTFQSNRHLGPVVTSSVSSTAPLFALPAAALLLGESISPKAVLASLGVAVGVWVLYSKRTGREVSAPKWALLLPVSGAMVRGLAQVAAKAGLMLWPNPFAASLIGYLISSLGVVAADRVVRTTQTRWSSGAAGWFVVTGVLNGTAVLLMYSALRGAPVSLVAPVIAAYPLVTVILSAVAFRDERIDRGTLVGSAVVIASVGYLVS
jgi:drug/metabolite transporter (DMT)-like permease